MESRQLLAATKIEIFAAGQSGQETMELQVDGALVAVFDNVGGDPSARRFGRYQYVHPTDVTADQIRVAFVNDLAGSGDGRSLTVNRIRLEGAVFQTEAPTTFSVFETNADSQCADGFNRTETLECNGYFAYSFSADGGGDVPENPEEDGAGGDVPQQAESTVQIFAAGATGEETIELQIDGVTVQTFFNVGGNPDQRRFRVLTYRHPSQVIADRVRVRFANEGFDANGNDRSITVNRIRIDGVVSQTEAATTFSAFDTANDGCTDGFRRTEVLDCNGYFAFEAAGGGDTGSGDTGSGNAGGDDPPVVETTINIFAAGATGEETIELQIDGTTVAEFLNVGGDPDSRRFRGFTYRHPAPVSADRVRVAFTNDGIAADGRDRSVTVNRIRIDGVAFQTEAATTFSVVDSADADCPDGFNRTEVLDCNGYFAYDQDPANVDGNPGGSTIQVFAAGETGEETALLQIDGETVATFTGVGGDPFTRSFEEFSYTHTSPVTPDQVRVVFPNNGIAADGGDRNLMVDRITIGETTYESEAPDVFSVGSAVAGVGCSSGFIETETLYCNGFFAYGQDPVDNGTVDDSNIRVFAAGETGEEALELQIEGVTVATFSNVGGDPLIRSFEEFSYTHTSPVTPDQVRVVFPNNGVTADGGDRNLMVDRITIGATTYESEAPNVFSVGSAVAGVGCTSGFVETETLYCDGYFQYGESSGSGDANPGTLALGATFLSVSEAAGSVLIPVTRTGGSDGIVSINYTTVAGTAEAVTDFVTNDGVLTLQDGQTEAFIEVAILDDAINEGNETFNIAVDQVLGGASLGQPRTSTITILDDEGGPTIGTGNGLLGTYYNDTDFLDFVLERTDPTINFDWGLGSPALSIDPDTFSIVWSGQIEPLYSETYTFQLGLDDSARVYVNDQLVIDQALIPATTPTGQIALQGGIRSEIRIEYREFGGGALMELFWSSASQTLEIVPQTQLYSEPPSGLGEGTFAGATVISGLSLPTAIEFTTGDRMLIAQKDGVVRIAQNGNLLPQPFIDISAEVNNINDRGLLGITVHPNFPATPYVYLLYTYDPPETAALTGLAGPDGAGNRVARLVRYTADATNNFNTVVPGSGEILLGKNSTFENISFPDQDSTNEIDLPSSCGPGGTLDDCLPSDSATHSVGAVTFGVDGSLLVTIGDGASFGQVDPRTARVQDLDSLSGKLLRIDPITGAGLPDNPFFMTGAPNSNRSKVYSYGLRNPFRFAVNPANGEAYIGDVGWVTWEEINVGRGANFGWPWYEGGGGQNLETGDYNLLPEAADFYANNDATPPLWSRNHADGSRAIIVGDFYTGDLYPTSLQNTLFITDFGDPVIRALSLNADGTVDRQLSVSGSVGTVVEMTMGPDGHMYYVDLIAGIVGRLEYTPPASPAVLSLNLIARADFDTDGHTDGSDFLAWQQRTSSRVESSLDLENWQAEYGQAVFDPAPDGVANANFAQLSTTSIADEDVLDAILAVVGEEDSEEGTLLAEPQQSLAWVAANSHSRALAIPLKRASDFESEVASVGSEEETSESQYWLSDELLEHVFG